MTYINDVMKQKNDTVLSKADIGEIENQTIVKILGSETFFTIFAE